VAPERRLLVHYRLCVDIDRIGQPIGASWEQRDADGAITYGTVLIGPFDSRQDALEACLGYLIELFGLQLAFAF
jgi:hypothetical protein